MEDKNAIPKLPIAKLSPPTLARMTDPAIAMSTIARLVASHRATTRSALVQTTGLARSTVDTMLSRLTDNGLIVSEGFVPTRGRGRPAEALGINPNAGVIVVAEITPHHLHIVIARMDQQLLAARRFEFLIDAGPIPTLDTVIATARELMEEAHLEPSRVRAVVASLPGPVDIKRGMPVRPPIMPGWDSFPVASYLSNEFSCPCKVDNDVNLIALGEARVLPNDQCPLLAVKIGTGIGGGLVTAGGEVHRGADGAACDIGHIQVATDTDVMCSCGNIGCIEALASAEAITKQYRHVTGNPDLTQRDLRQAARVGDPVAIRLIRDAAALLGSTIASLVHIYNPARIVITGPLTAVTDDLLAGIRSVAYQRALPLATRNLTLTHSVIGQMGGVLGAIVLGIETVLDPVSLGGDPSYVTE